jgi:hypothetical protein
MCGRYRIAATCSSGGSRWHMRLTSSAATSTHTAERIASGGRAARQMRGLLQRRLSHCPRCMPSSQQSLTSCFAGAVSANPQVAMSAAAASRSAPACSRSTEEPSAVRGACRSAALGSRAQGALRLQAARRRARNRGAFVTVSLRRGGAGQGIELPSPRSGSSSTRLPDGEGDAGPRFRSGYTAAELSAYYRGRPDLVLRRLVTLSGAALNWLATEALAQRDEDAVAASRRRAVRTTHIPTLERTRLPWRESARERLRCHVGTHVSTRGTEGLSSAGGRVPMVSAARRLPPCQCLRAPQRRVYMRALCGARLSERHLTACWRGYQQPPSTLHDSPSLSLPPRLPSSGGNGPTGAPWKPACDSAETLDTRREQRADPPLTRVTRCDRRARAK